MEAVKLLSLEYDFAAFNYFENRIEFFCNQETSGMKAA